MKARLREPITFTAHRFDISEDGGHRAFISVAAFLPHYPGWIVTDVDTGDVDAFDDKLFHKTFEVIEDDKS